MHLKRNIQTYRSYVERGDVHAYWKVFNLITDQALLILLISFVVLVCVRWTLG